MIFILNISNTHALIYICCGKKKPFAYFPIPIKMISSFILEFICLVSNNLILVFYVFYPYYSYNLLKQLPKSIIFFFIHNIHSKY